MPMPKDNEKGGGTATEDQAGDGGFDLEVGQDGIDIETLYNQDDDAGDAGSDAGDDAGFDDEFGNLDGDAGDGDDGDGDGADNDDDPKGGDQGRDAGRKDDAPADGQDADVARQQNALLTEAIRRLRARPDWDQLRAVMEGREDPVEDQTEAEYKTLVSELFEDEAAPKFQRLVELIAEKAERRAEKKFKPVAEKVIRDTNRGIQAQALRAAGVAPKEIDSKTFRAFLDNYHAENPWITQVRNSDPEAAARLIARNYAALQRRARGSDTRARRDASLEARGGTSRAAGSDTRKGPAKIPANASIKEIFENL